MAEYDERIRPASGGADQQAWLQNFLATVGPAPTSQADTPIIPLWGAKPRPFVNAGEFDDAGGQFHSRRTAPPQAPLTQSQASAQWLDMEADERSRFREMAIRTGLVTPDETGYVSDAELYRGWRSAVEVAAEFNGQQPDAKKWLSPWDAVNKMALGNASNAGAEFDPFRPRTSKNVVKRDFTKGEGFGSLKAQAIAIYQEELGRDPSDKEINAMARAIQAAYDASPETATTVTQMGRDGNTSSTQTVTGGVDVAGNLLDRVRNTTEEDAHQARTTYFEAAMQALNSPV